MSPFFGIQILQNLKAEQAKHEKNMSFATVTLADLARRLDDLGKKQDIMWSAPTSV